MTRLRISVLLGVILGSLAGVALSNPRQACAAPMPGTIAEDMRQMPGIVPASTTLPAPLVATIQAAAANANADWTDWLPVPWGVVNRAGTQVPRLWTHESDTGDAVARGEMSGGSTQDLSFLRSWILAEWATVASPITPEADRHDTAAMLCTLVAHEVGHRYLYHTDDPAHPTGIPNAPFADLMMSTPEGTAPGCDDLASTLDVAVVRARATRAPCPSTPLARSICAKLRKSVSPNKKNYAHAYNWRFKR